MEEEQYEFAEYAELSLTIRKKRDEITSVSQTLNYVLVHHRTCDETRIGTTLYDQAHHAHNQRL
eukprot:2843874-Amphidinium_carterae.1